MVNTGASAYGHGSNSLEPTQTVDSSIKLRPKQVMKGKNNKFATLWLNDKIISAPWIEFGLA